MPTPPSGSFLAETPSLKHAEAILEHPLIIGPDSWSLSIISDTYAILERSFSSCGSVLSCLYGPRDSLLFIATGDNILNKKKNE